MGRPRQLGSALVFATLAALAALACNSILGVEDVTMKDPAKRSRTGDGGGAGDDDDDDAVGDDDDDVVVLPDGGTAPVVDRGTFALGFNHGCARIPGGTVKCWGDNGAGQLGDSIPFEEATRPGEAPTPQPVPNLVDVVAIASGLSHTCAVRRTGTVACWGYNFFGQLGNGTKTRSSSPVDVLTLADAVGVSGGQSFTCAIRRDKTAVCWGANYSGQLGDGTKIDTTQPVAVKTLANVVALSAATHHVCALVEGGEVLCWGQNTQGQLGIGSTAESLAPTKLSGLGKVAQVAAAERFTCAREEAGRVLCWGNNEFGQLGNGSPNVDPNPSPIIVPSIGDATFIWTGFEHACAVRKAGTVSCWGRGNDGQTGGVAATDAITPTPAAVPGISRGARAVWTGGNNACALMDDGKAFCWGSNTLGQLGNGTKDKATGAVPMTNFP